MTSKICLGLLLIFMACKNDDKPTTTTRTPQQIIAPQAIDNVLDTARCFGTEPFWDVQISEKNKTIVFNLVSDEGKIVTFPYIKPQIEGEQTIYETSVGKDKLTIKLTKGNCSDGMSDIEHAYSSALVFNGKKFSGCAAR